MLHVDKRQTTLIFENNYILPNFDSNPCFRYISVQTKSMTKKSKYCFVMQWFDKIWKSYTVDFLLLKDFVVFEIFENDDAVISMIQY